MKPIIEWADRNDVAKLYTGEYWNNIAEEKKKPWWVDGTDGSAFHRYLNASGLLEEFDLGIDILSRKNFLRGKVLDVAAGVCWTSAILSRYDCVEQVDALDFSWHRLNDLAPRCCTIMGGRPEKIQRIFGSFYEIGQHREKYYDLVIMSQAFHHADQPFRLLAQCDAAIKDSGAILLVGEHHISMTLFLRRAVKTALLEGKLTLNFRELFKPDDVLGDHYYRLNDYYTMFRSLGYCIEYHKTNIRNSMLIIARKGLQ